MRAVQNPQMQIGEVDISQIKFDPKSRDDIRERPSGHSGCPNMHFYESLRPLPTLEEKTKNK